MKSTVYLHFSEFWRNDQIQHDYGTVRNTFPKYGKILPCTDCITHYYVCTLETLEYKGGYREAQLGNEAKVDSSLEALWKKNIFSYADHIYNWLYSSKMFCSYYEMTMGVQMCSKVPWSQIFSHKEKPRARKRFLSESNWLNNRLKENDSHFEKQMWVTQTDIH